MRLVRSSTSFLVILLLSYYWCVVKVCPQVHKALQGICGETYHHRFIPRRVRELVAALDPQAREEKRAQVRERAERMRALEELQAERVQMESSAL